MEETNDGFVIADKDLKLRGPGEFFGLKQSGFFKFKQIEFLERLIVAWVAEPPFTWIGIILTKSGRVGDSTLKTSAPKSASIIEAKGPGSNVEKSRIFNEDRIAGILF